MKFSGHLRKTGAIVAFLCLLGAGWGPWALALEIGDDAPAFDLQSTEGSGVSLGNFADKPVLAVIFTCNHCPYAQAYEQRIIHLQREFGERGFQAVAINPNDAVAYPDDSFEAMQVRHKDKGFNFPYLRDESQAVARAYGAERTPHIFLFDARRVLRYTGKIDDNWENPDAVKETYLRDAILALLDNRDPAQAKTFAIGCSIKWKK